MRPAHQPIHGHAERLAGDVVQRDINGRDGAGQYPPAFEVLAAIHFLPQRAAAHGVFAEQELAVVSDRTYDRQLAARNT